MHTIIPAAVQIPAAGVIIDSDLRVPSGAAGLVLFHHTSPRACSARIAAKTAKR